jgi:hypothetical protein
MRQGSLRGKVCGSFGEGTGRGGGFSLKGSGGLAEVWFGVCEELF